MKKKPKENWLKIVDLVANARGIVDLAEAEKIFHQTIVQGKRALLGELEMPEKILQHCAESCPDCVRDEVYNQIVKEQNTKLKRLKGELTIK